MPRLAISRFLAAFALSAVVLLCPSQGAFAQVMPAPMPDDPDMPLDPGTGAGGVEVDANGVLRRKLVADPTGQLLRQRVLAAKAALGAKVATKSKMRKVSLNRLEAAIKEGLAQNTPVTDEMKHLAGLTRVEYVFFYPDTKDIVIAGPAEGWFVDQVGRVRGAETGRPIVELQDLVVALRAFPPGKTKQHQISVSIDPTKEGLAKMQAFLRSVGSRATPGDTQFIVNGLRESLGLQKISVNGVPSNTHFAQVMVEADYRMKLIGIGLERPEVKIPSYVQNANPAAVSRNALQRWFFVPDYQCVRVADDNLAMQIVGDGVKLIGADELVNADGTRSGAGTSDRASKVFVEGFTTKYGALAARSPVYAQLRNVIDLAVVAAFMQSKDYYGKADWKMPVLGDEQQYSVQTLNAPTEVESAVTSVWKGRTLMTPIGGGVKIQAQQAMSSANLLEDEGGKVREARENTKLDGLAKGQWWWD